MNQYTFHAYHDTLTIKTGATPANTVGTDMQNISPKNTLNKQIPHHISGGVFYIHNRRIKEAVDKTNKNFPAVSPNCVIRYSQLL